MLSEISQRKTNTGWYHLYVESKEKLKTQTYTYREHIGGCQRFGEIDEGGQKIQTFS